MDVFHECILVRRFLLYFNGPNILETLVVDVSNASAPTSIGTVTLVDLQFVTVMRACVVSIRDLSGSWNLESESLYLFCILALALSRFLC